MHKIQHADRLVHIARIAEIVDIAAIRKRYETWKVVPACNNERSRYYQRVTCLYPTHIWNTIVHFRIDGVGLCRGNASLSDIPTGGRNTGRNIGEQRKAKSAIAAIGRRKLASAPFTEKTATELPAPIAALGRYLLAVPVVMLIVPTMPGLSTSSVKAPGINWQRINRSRRVRPRNQKRHVKSGPQAIQHNYL